MSEAPLTVGQTVERARTAAGMTVAQVAAATRVRATVISAIEKDDFRLCGGDVYARGHLKSIATAVGIDPAELAAHFDEQQGASRPAVPVVEPIDQPTRVMDASGSLSALAGTLGSSSTDRRGANWTAVMALAFVAVVVVGAISLLSNRGGEVPAAANTPTPTPSSTPSVTAPASSPAATPSDSASPTTSPSDVVAEGNGVTVVLDVTGSASWIRATTASGKTLYEGTLQQGERKTFRDKTKVKLLIGSAGAVELTVNGKSLGSPGGNGQVVRTEFGPGDPTNPSA